MEYSIIFPRIRITHGRIERKTYGVSVEVFGHRAFSRALAVGVAIQELQKNITVNHAETMLLNNIFEF